ncbi:hypothetical protein PHYBLDRAFT_142657 [Phycomyces blakesleeanus NRRL 1555(-)]|uniref:Uncharacterized protein n=1 Tax=Phycomyces blakesleeanus (strain ATCC 8743b / DSM 1359 / FGSC 10004 / NBRC 33097 / NRRL 1555) TaxID=763407 RepID=A0A162PYG4_PHYB8|nr:hypothetical protein PHYBLDRAFT_142657 [Phycomyces blakesleeanus NRRL 1555(-)]OAD77147.1 hypothetical protein PHYBLDRAFT_142657 [Phycomyces blakesleeanus NRRL 1555(-)]|eukprot:XP_018295187.1 hypothetical protein PHYBLDRAFT_142657 [Phycomyces blakesleeanus NRRL 1555(-)]
MKSWPIYKKKSNGVDNSIREEDYERIPCWKRSTKENSIIFCLCSPRVSDRLLLDAIKTKFPNEKVISSKKLSKSCALDHTYCPYNAHEYILSSKEICKELYTNGLVIDNKTIYPIPSLPSKSEIYVGRLLCVPITDEDSPVKQLEKFLKKYGNPLHIQLKKISDLDDISWNAFVVLDRTVPTINKALRLKSLLPFNLEEYTFVLCDWIKIA